MNKVAPKISSPGSSKFPTKGPHNPNVGTHGSGLAPKPSGGAAIKGNDRPSMPASGGLARVADVGGAKPAASVLPVKNNANRGLAGPKVGQANPQTGAAATSKPKRRGLGAAFYGEY